MPQTRSAWASYCSGVAAGGPSFTSTIIWSEPTLTFSFHDRPSGVDASSMCSPGSSFSSLRAPAASGPQGLKSTESAHAVSEVRSTVVGRGPIGAGLAVGAEGRDFDRTAVTGGGLTWQSILSVT